MLCNVDRLTVTEEPADRGVDLAVRGSIEVLGIEDLDHVGHGFGRQEHGPQHGPFGFEVLRWEAMAGGDPDDLFSRACHPWTPPFRTPTPTAGGGYAHEAPGDSGQHLWIAEGQVVARLSLSLRP